MPDDDAQSLHGTHGEVLTAVSDGMVALLKEFYGRGPTQAKTYYYDDLVVCLLRGGFTRGCRIDLPGVVALRSMRGAAVDALRRLRGDSVGPREAAWRPMLAAGADVPGGGAVIRAVG
jgi:hypothetical protein